jgi:hypothetical protein
MPDFELTDNELLEAIEEYKKIKKVKDIKPTSTTLINRRLDTPWELIEKEYVFGLKIFNKEDGLYKLHFPTYSELAEKYGISKQSIQQKSCKDEIASWARKRQLYLKKVKDKVADENFELLNDISVQKDIETLKRSADLDKVIDDVIQQLNEECDIDEQRFTVQDKVKMITGLVTALDKSHKLTRTILNERDKSNTEHKPVNDNVDDKKATIVSGDELDDIAILIETRENHKKKLKSANIETD